MRFLILTAARRGEVTGDNDKNDPKPPMDWNEIDLAAKLWTIPAERMKNDAVHTVPLTDAAISCLPPRATGQVFPGTPYNNGEVFKKLMRGTDATTHGFRSAFTDWAIDTTGTDEIAQLCLSHKKGTKVERSYRRSTAVGKRRELMEAWAQHVTGSKHRDESIRTEKLVAP
jgi:integrase